MRLVIILITLTFVAFAGLQFDDPDLGVWMSVYLAGGLISGAALLQGLPRIGQRVLAVGTMLLMFFYFFGFFKLAPGLGELWWQTEVGREAVGLFVGGFALMPVLSCYSCRLKATRASKDRRAPAVFSSPHS